MHKSKILQVSDCHLEGGTNNEEGSHELEQDANSYEHVHFEIITTRSSLLEDIEKKKHSLNGPQSFNKHLHP